MRPRFLRPGGSSGPAGRVSSAVAAAGPGSANARGDEDEGEVEAAGEDGGAGSAGGCVRPTEVRVYREGHAPGWERPSTPPGLGGRASWRGRDGGGTWERRADRAQGPILCRRRRRRRAGCSSLGGRREAGWASPVSWGLPSLLRAWPWCCARELARRRAPRAAGAAPAQRQPVACRAERRSPRPGVRPAPARPGPPLPAGLRARSPVPRPRRREEVPARSRRAPGSQTRPVGDFLRT